MSLVNFFKKYKYVFASFGPGLAVMFADTEAGSVITAAQSGAVWGYKLLLFQFLFIPFLYITQELSARLALSSKKGFVELIKLRFGKTTALALVITLILSCFGALVTEISGLAGVAQVFGIPLWLSASAITVLILFMITVGSYRSIEGVAIFLGLFELAFIFMAWRSHPDLSQIKAQMFDMPILNHNYLYLLAANLGTCIMPWAIFYQQSASIDKKMTLSSLKMVRVEIFFGAIICQILTASILIASASIFNQSENVNQLESIPQIANAMSYALGGDFGKIIFAIGLSGGALVATIVVCLTAAWSVGELLGLRHSLEKHPLDAPWFYGFFALMLILGDCLVVFHANLIQLSIDVGVLNAVILPIILYFLYYMSKKESFNKYGLKGAYSIFVAVSFILISLVGLGASLIGVFGITL